jgi:GNAT superfamily N-acetyltransferase
MDYTIRLTDIADESTRHAVLDPLVAYNRAMTGRDDHRPLILTIDAPTGEVIGGLWGQTAYDWLFVALLFVPEFLRRRGVGRDLLLRAEREALSRGCHSAWLDTFEFQAPGFYERLGYQCFGTLADYPHGSARYFLRKALTSTASSRAATE